MYIFYGGGGGGGIGHCIINGLKSVLSIFLIFTYNDILYLQFFIFSSHNMRTLCSAYTNHISEICVLCTAQCKSWTKYL
jgi:hypothetical protein